MVWTEGVVSLTANLWAQGYTGGQVAAAVEREFGQPLTKNQVICKMSRMGVRHGERPKDKPATAAPVAPLPAPIQSPPVVVKAPSRPPVPAAPAGGILLREARLGDCRWIEGAPTADAMCCGAPALPGKSWCPVHTRLVFSRYQAGRR